MLKLKVYGTTKGETRIKRKHHYYAVTRDKFGHFKTTRRWSRKRPVKKDVYKEKYVEAETGKEARRKVAKSIEEEQWIEKEVEYW